MAPTNPDLHVVIIGAGMGGLATALSLAKQGFTHIDVYETASNLGFVGAGIQLAPNMGRILDRFGVWDPIEKEAVDVQGASIRDGPTNNELAHIELGYMKRIHGYKHMVGHRSNLAGSLYEGCKREKSINFFFSTACEQMLSFSPKPTFLARPRKGEPYEVTSDILLAADGIKSVVRDEMLKELKIDPSEVKVVDTNQAAYRIMLRRDQLENDPELLKLIDFDGVTRWVGEKKHIIAYSVSSKQIYNISTAHPDKNFSVAPSSTYTTKGSKADMLAMYAEFCPLVHRMLDLVPDGEVCEWKLRVHSPLPTWIHGSVALVGDACHPTLPHLNQGAAQAIEDGAVLGVVISKIPQSEDPATQLLNITKSLKVYEKVRKERAETLVELAAQSGRALHLGAGAAKEERDRQFAAAKTTGKEGVKVPDKFADRETQDMIYGTDVVKIAEDDFDKMFDEVDVDKLHSFA